MNAHHKIFISDYVLLARISQFQRFEVMLPKDEDMFTYLPVFSASKKKHRMLALPKALIYSIK